jgi:cytidine deaminase
MKESLREIATQARARAYAPYSKFLVGAALLSASGRVFAGCNVENISFGLTMCAERVCVGNAAQEGERDFESITIVSDSNEPVMPCGACRQVLAEFSPNMTIVSWTVHGEKKEISLAILLPLSRQGILR